MPRSKPATEATDTTPYFRMLGRMLAAAGRKVGRTDPADLAQLAALRDDLEAAMVTAIAGQRADGITWASIGEAMGVTGSAIIIRYGAAVKEATARGAAAR